MNTEVIKQEIQSLIDANNKKYGYRRQHAPSKTRINQLTELGVIEFMPKNFGNTDAAVIIEAASDAGGKMQGAYGSDNWTSSNASTLYQLLNAPEAEAVAITAIEETVELKASDIKSGMQVRVKADATWFDYSAPGYGTLVEPIEKLCHAAGKIVTVYAVYVEELEDEHGNRLDRHAIDTDGGMFSVEQLELI